MTVITINELYFLKLHATDKRLSSTEVMLIRVFQPFVLNFSPVDVQFTEFTNVYAKHTVVAKVEWLRTSILSEL